MTPSRRKLLSASCSNAAPDGPEDALAGLLVDALALLTRPLVAYPFLLTTVDREAPRSAGQSSSLARPR